MQLELTHDEYAKLKDYSKEKGIIFFCNTA